MNILRIVGAAHGVPDSREGAYVVACDVDAHRGRGRTFTTLDPQNAMRFEDAGEALEYWKRQSTVLPLRPDGKPNRPLTAFTVEVVEVDGDVIL